MKVAIVQTEFSTQFRDAERIVQWELDAMDALDSSVDVVVFPEGSHAPALAHSDEERAFLRGKMNDLVLKKARETAKRCNTLFFINGVDKTDKGYRNTTFAIDRNGEIIGKYYKKHLTPSEMESLDNSYTLEYSEPYVLEIEGLRFGFLTCYDFYFYEAFPNIARQKVDIIIGCSHQRSDRHDALELITRFLAYHTNAYVLRSSVSMGENSDVGGCSMVVAPDGKTLLNFYNRVGIEYVEIDPSAKYYKPAGYGNPPAPHYEYVEAGRRPWQYRPSGSSVVCTDEWMAYPRVCAHRGFSSVAPENSFPAWGSAVALGAEEIEFDLWFSKDGEIVSSHELEMQKLTDGEGWLLDMTYEQLKQLDFGVNWSERLQGMRIVLFEEILQKFAGQTVFNIHVKSLHDDAPVSPYSDEQIGKIIRLLRKYDCMRHSYIMTSSVAMIAQFKRLAPEIRTCMGAGYTDEDKWNIVDRAIASGCQKVQLFAPYYNQEMIDKAHANGIKCNFFFADDVELAQKLLDMGVDTILSNNYLEIANAVKAWKMRKEL